MPVPLGKTGLGDYRSARIDRWRIELKGDVDEAFILEGLQNGFDLMDVDNMQDVRFAECNNNKVLLVPIGNIL